MRLGLALILALILVVACTASAEDATTTTDPCVEPRGLWDATISTTTTEFPVSADTWYRINGTSIELRAILAEQHPDCFDTAERVFAEQNYRMLEAWRAEE